MSAFGIALHRDRVLEPSSMSEPPVPFPPGVGAVVQSLITGRLDHGPLLRMPDMRSRNFWVGAAIGAGLTLLLKSRASSASTSRSCGSPSDRD